jgi:tetratricopeptide (TPR) repeat protein
MRRTAIWSLSLFYWLAAGVLQSAAVASETPGPPVPFEFGPDWRWVPPSGRFPSREPGRDTAEPKITPPNRTQRRPDALGATETLQAETLQAESAARAEALRKAMAPRPNPVVARQEKIAALFDRLASERDPDTAKRLAESLEAVWFRSGSETADLLMQRASAAIAKGNYRLALELLDKITLLEPAWVEVWNRRATVHSEIGDADGAMTDIDRILKLEPRHFGALIAMGTILEKEGFEQRALEVFRRVLAIYPLLPLLQDHVDRLEISVEGRGI